MRCLKEVTKSPAFSEGAKARNRCFCVKKKKLFERSEFFFFSKSGDAAAPER